MTSSVIFSSKRLIQMVTYIVTGNWEGQMVPAGHPQDQSSDQGQIFRTYQDQQRRQMEHGKLDPTLESSSSQRIGGTILQIKGGSSHYKGGIEPLHLIESKNLPFHLANVIKYVVRAHYYNVPHQNKSLSLEAIDKAIWYLNRYKEINS